MDVTVTEREHGPESSVDRPRAVGFEAREVRSSRQRQTLLGAPLTRDRTLLRALDGVAPEAPIGSGLFAAAATVLVHLFTLDAAQEFVSHE